LQLSVSATLILARLIPEEVLKGHPRKLPEVGTDAELGLAGWPYLGWEAQVFCVMEALKDPLQTLLTYELCSIFEICFGHS